jgi:AcrR family transcriptional regulator
MNDAPLRPLPGFAERVRADGTPLPSAPADDRRDRILAATAELVAEHGYHPTTLEQIVRRAHVGWPVFYKCFADKEAAFLAVVDETFAAAAARMERAAERAAGPWPARVAAALGAFLDAVAVNPDHARACLVEVLTAGPAGVARYENALQAVRPLLREGRALNPRTAELSDTLEDTLAGAVAWIVYQRLVEDEAGEAPGLLPETLEFVLLPYLGEEETARAVERWAPPHSGKKVPPAGTAA